jgi:hypothetical protein
MPRYELADEIGKMWRSEPRLWKRGGSDAAATTAHLSPQWLGGEACGAAAVSWNRDRSALKCSRVPIPKLWRGSFVVAAETDPLYLEDLHVGNASCQEAM